MLVSVHPKKEWQMGLKQLEGLRTKGSLNYFDKLKSLNRKDFMGILCLSLIIF